MRKHGRLFIVALLLLLAPSLASAWTLYVKVQGNSSDGTVTITDSAVPTAKVVSLKGGQSYVQLTGDATATLTLATGIAADVKINYADATPVAGVYALPQGTGSMSVSMGQAASAQGAVAVVKAAGGNTLVQYLGKNTMTGYTGLAFGTTVGVKANPNSDYKVASITITDVAASQGTDYPQTGAAGEAKTIGLTIASTAYEVSATYELVANAKAALSAPLKAVVGKSVTLSANGTTANTAVTYEFVVGGVSKQNTDSKSYTFTPDAEGALAVVLNVKDGATTLATKTASINVVSEATVYNTLCIGCHSGSTPQVITDYNASKHGTPALSCQSCHSAPHGVVSTAAVPTFFVKDTTGAALVGATVYAIPVADVAALAGQPLTLTNGVYSADALKVDEPLEDLINGNFVASGVATYKKGVTGADGKAEIADLPVGASDKFFIFVQPADAAKHLPGGSLCRVAVTGASLDDKVTEVKVSTKPSATATFVGTSSCLVCHADKEDMLKTAHKLGFMNTGAPSGLQDLSKFDGDDAEYNLGAALAKYTPGDATSGGTTIYFSDYDSTRKFDKFKTSETASGTVYATVRIYSNGGKYWAKFTNIINSADPSMTHEVVLTYGGGVYKQRPITKVDDSLFMIPLQFNPRGSDASADRTKKIWRDYHLDWWWNANATPSLSTFKTKPGASNSVDVQCAPCHFNGYNVAKNDTTGYYTAQGVADVNGETHPVLNTKQELNIGCETCHGPGSEHVAFGGMGKAIVTPQNTTPEREVAICVQCHTRPQGNDSFGIKKDSPLNSSNKMMVAGTSRADFLAQNTSRHDASQSAGDIWGDQHSKSHHQQATDFIQSGKYRNDSQLLTCASCHDLHAPGTDRHQLSGVSDNSKCISCHTGVDSAAHQKSKTGVDGHVATEAKCIDCHNAKTSTSGAGLNPMTPFIGDSTGSYYTGDISSHRFDVPAKAAAVSAKMPVPYTNTCGTCHLGTGL